MKQLAIIGYGNMGRTHARNLSKLPDQFTITGIVDISESARANAASDGFKAFATLEELFIAASVDICLIALPNDLHKEYAIACMEAGKHVICEKPVALNESELEDILSVSAKTGMVFTVDQNRRWDRDYLPIKKLYEHNSLGQLLYIDSNVQGTHGLPDNWLSKKGVGGMLLDWGVHLLDQLLYMIPSPVTSVFTHAVILDGKECEENIKVFLTFADGSHAQVQTDTRCYCKLPRWYVMYENGTAVIPDINADGLLFVKGNDISISREGYSTGSGPSRTLAPSEDVISSPLDADVNDDFIGCF